MNSELSTVNHPRDRGFTLLEVTIATGLLVVIALGTAQLFGLAIRHNMSARHQLVMSLAAARKIDEICAAAASDGWSPSPPDALERGIEGFADVTMEAGVTCVRRWLLAVAPGAAGGAIAVAVRVSGPGAGDVQIVAVCAARVS